MDSFDILDRYPGILGIGIVQRVTARQVNEFIKKQPPLPSQKQFKIKLISFNPTPNYPNASDDRYIISYITPSHLNEIAAGLDLGSERHRLQAIELARDTGKPTATLPVTLVRMNRSKGFLLFLPLYEGNVIPKTISERRRKLRRFVYTSIVFEQFFKNTLSINYNDIYVRAFTPSLNGPDELVYSSGKPPLTKRCMTTEQRINFAQQELILTWQRPYGTTAIALTSSVGFIASLFTLMLASLLVGIENITRRAEDLVEERTAMLKESEQNVRLLNQNLEKLVSERTLELQRAFKKLQLNEQRLRELADSMPQIVWITNADGTTEYFNQRWYDFTGACFGSHSAGLEYIHPEDRLMTKDLWRTALNTKSSFEVELRIWNQPSQKYIWHLARTVPVLKHDQTVSNWYGTCTDIHLQKQLRVEQQKLISIIENNPDATLLFNGDWEIIYLNPAAQRLTGLKENQTVIVTELFPQVSFFKDIIFSSVTQLGKWEGELEIKNLNDGLSIITHSHCFLIRDQHNGQPLATAIVARDISDLKSAELERIAAHGREEAARAASKLKSDFLANMSHEIRTPVNGIIGMTDLIARTELDPEQHDMIESLKHAGDSLLALVNDILDFSKIEAGMFELINEPFDFKELIDSTQRTFDHEVIRRNIPLKVELAPGIPAVLQGDGPRLRQILLNLISNAFKFSHEGEIRLRVTSKVIRAGQVGLHFSVTDNGIGINAEDITKLFSPFTQADGSVMRKFGGTGLGLSISKFLAEKMGGTIGVESIPGKGSTFWFEVMLAEVQPTSVVSNSATHQFRQGLRVLVAEDNAINQKVFALMLQSLGMEIFQAKNGEEALQLTQAHDFDVILMDCQMPVMDGYHATRKIRTDCPRNAATPILAVTAHAGKDEHERCLEAGMNDCLMKPIGLERLAQSLAQWIKGVSPMAQPTEKPEDPLKGIYQRLREIYREQTPGQMQQIGQALANSDYKAAAFEVHRLKSGALMLGHQRIGDLCQLFEVELNRSVPADQLNTYWLDLQQAVQQSLQG